MNAFNTWNALSSGHASSGECAMRRQTSSTREYSKESLVSAMDGFLSAVQNMKDTVMVPSVLQGVIVTESNGAHSPVAGASTADVAPEPDEKTFDALGCYKMLDIVSTELTCGAPLEPESVAAAHVSPISSTGNLNRQSGTSNVGSVCEESEDCDSEFTDAEAGSLDLERSTISSSIRYHLNGLFGSLRKLTELADGLSTQYTEQMSK